MRVPRVLVRAPVADQATLTLDPTAAHHVHRVLRLRPGDRIVLFDGQGGEYAGTLATVTGREVRAHVEEHRPDDRALAAVRVHLWQAVCRGGRMDTAVEKATELGVARIVPVMTQRAVVRLAGERAQSRREHWQRVVESACEQCGLNRPPRVETPVSLQEALASEGDRGREVPSSAARWYLSPGATCHLAEAAARLPLPGDLTLLVGPEGGLEAGEEQMLQRAGFEAVGLGPRILRADTAGPAALAMVQALVHGSVDAQTSRIETDHKDK